MFMGIMGVLIILVIITLYGCLRASTDYDEQVEDDMQEAFLRQYQQTKSLNHKHTKTNRKK